MIKNLYSLARKADTIEELGGNASELLELANERSWLFAYWCHRAKEISGPEGVREISRYLPISPTTCRHYAETWGRFSRTRKKYPRLQFSYFMNCYQSGLDGKQAKKALDIADDESMKPASFRNMLRGEHQKHKCTCPACGSKHIKKE